MTTLEDKLKNIYKQAEKAPNSFSPGNVDYDTSYRGVKADRTAFQLGTVDPSFNPIFFWVNPSECSWRIPLRTTIEQVQGGAVHHEWDATSLNNTSKFDQPTVNFSFQAGNIAPFGGVDVSKTIPEVPNVFEQPGGSYRKTQNLQEAYNVLISDNRPVIPAGLGNFYDFLNLLNQPNITKDGRENYVVIHYVSLMLPSLTLKGFFTSDGVQWNDSADNPQGITSWGASFVVFESDPPMHSGDRLREIFSTHTFDR